MQKLTHGEKASSPATALSPATRAATGCLACSEDASATSVAFVPLTPRPVDDVVVEPGAHAPPNPSAAGVLSPLTPPRRASLETTKRVSFRSNEVTLNHDQLDATLAKQRHRGSLVTTLRCSERTAPAGGWVQPGPRKDAGRLRQDIATEPFSGGDDPAHTGRHTPADVRAAEGGVAVSQRLAAIRRKGSEKRGKTGVAALPRHVRRLWSLYHPEEVLCDGDNHAALVRTLDRRNAIDHDEQVKAEIGNLRTGEDAIAFFSKHGASTDLKFVHAVHANVDEAEFRPYDLCVVPEEEAGGGEFFTISTKGVLHVRPGCLSQRLSLSDWVSQAMAFNVLSSMSFFRRFLHAKLFGQWKAFVRQATFRALRARLSGRLFLAKPVFVEAQVEAQGVLREMAITHFDLSCGSPPPLELDAFMTRMSSQFQVVDFESRMDKVRAVVDTLLETVVQAGQDEHDPAWQRRRPPTRFQFQRRERAEEHLRRIHMCEQNSTSLGSFLRLIDVMLQSALVDFVVAQTMELHDKVRKTPKLFCVSVQFLQSKGSTVQFAPCKLHFEKVFQELIQRAVKIGNSVTPLAETRKYDAYGQERATDDGSPALARRGGEVASVDANFNAAQTSLFAKLDEDMGLADAFADAHLKPLRSINDYLLDCDANLQSGHVSHIELADKMRTVMGFEGELEKLKSFHGCGHLSLEMRTLRQGVEIQAKDKLAAMKAKLRSIAREAAHDALALVEQAIRALSSRPSPERAQRFVDYADTYRRWEAQLHELVARRLAVDDMFALARVHHIRMSLDDELEKELLEKKCAQLAETVLPEARAFVQQNSDGTASTSEMGSKYGISSQSSMRYRDATRVSMQHDEDADDRDSFPSGGASRFSRGSRGSMDRDTDGYWSGQRTLTVEKPLNF